MFIAMNRFKVTTGNEGIFEKMWFDREIHIDRVPGFVAFHLLRGPAGEGHVLYSTHTLWQDRDAFEAWTRSPEFHAAHRNAGAGVALTLGHPDFEGFEIIQEVLPAEPVAA